MVVHSAELCEASGTCSRLVESGAGAIASALEQASQWGRANDRPIHLGEFGVFAANGQTAISERAEWTALVRNVAAELGMSLSYWEFAAGFGAFDRPTDGWNLALFVALAPRTENSPSGDADCDGQTTLGDAFAIVQFAVGTRAGLASCPVTAQTSLSLTSADIDRNGSVNLADALAVVQCAVGLPNEFC